MHYLLSFLLLLFSFSTLGQDCPEDVANNAEDGAERPLNSNEAPASSRTGSRGFEEGTSNSNRTSSHDVDRRGSRNSRSYEGGSSRGYDSYGTDF